MINNIVFGKTHKDDLKSSTRSKKKKNAQMDIGMARLDNATVFDLCSKCKPKFPEKYYTSSVLVNSLCVDCRCAFMEMSNSDTIMGAIIDVG